MLRRTTKFSRTVLIGALVTSVTAAAAVADTIHTFAVSQTTGSEGATTFLQTSAGSALQAKVAAGPSTALGTPFGIYGKYDPSSSTSTTSGIGVLGISTLGWGVIGSSLDGFPALEAYPNSNDGVGLDARSQNAEAIYGASFGGADGADIYDEAPSSTTSGLGGAGVYTVSEKGSGIYSVGEGGDGIDAYSQSNGLGVYGQSGSGFGVEGFSSTSDGVHAEIDNASSGVAGFNDGSGAGTFGQSTSGVRRKRACRRDRFARTR